MPAQPLHYSSAAEVSHVYNSLHAPQLLHGASYSDGHLAHGVQQQSILRTHGGTISQISKQVVSPHSHVSKFDTRINNDGLKTISYASPSISHGYASAPIAYKSAPLIAQSHYAAAPVAYSHHQPAIISQHGHGLATAPLAYSHQPALISQHGHGHGLGHVSYSSPIVNYGW